MSLAEVVDVAAVDDEPEPRLPMAGTVAVAPKRPVDLAALMSLSQRLANVPEFVPSAFRNRPEAILAALLTGAELGLGPMQSLRSIHVIEGRPALSAEVMRALVLAAGHELVVDEATDERCEVRARRRDSDVWCKPVVWTLDRARRAKLANRSNWQNYPRQMLLARATSELCRTYFADVIGGLEAVELVEDDGTKAPARAPRKAVAPSPEKVAPRTPSKALDGPAAPDTPDDSASPPAGATGADKGQTKKPATPRRSGGTAPPDGTAEGGGVGGSPPPTSPRTLPTASGGTVEVAEPPLPFPDESQAPPQLASTEERDRRAMHAAIAEAFPNDAPERRDMIRHALVALVTRNRQSGPVASSTELEIGERMSLMQRLSDIRAGRMLVGVASDATVEVASGPWRYYVDLSTDPPTVRGLDTRKGSAPE